MVKENPQTKNEDHQQRQIPWGKEAFVMSAEFEKWAESYIGDASGNMNKALLAAFKGGLEAAAKVCEDKDEGSVDGLNIGKQSAS